MEIQQPLTLKEAATFAKVHTSTLRTAWARGQLRAVNVGHGKRVVLRIMPENLTLYLSGTSSTNGKPGE